MSEKKTAPTPEQPAEKALTPARRAPKTDSEKGEKTSPPSQALTDADSKAEPQGRAPNLFDPKVGEGFRRLALRALFRQPQFSVPDGLNEYDEDYRFFTARGDLLTHDMQRALQRVKEELTVKRERERLTRAEEADHRPAGDGEGLSHEDEEAKG